MTKTRRRTGDPAVYDAMRLVLANGLSQDDSAFTRGVAVWTYENFSAAGEHFIDQPDLGKDAYLTKLERQLAGAVDQVIQLMAELHFIHLLIPSTTSGKKKREILDTVLGFMKQPVELPASLVSALDYGFINPGTFYLTRRDAQLSFLIEFGQAWKALDQPKQSDLLQDAWGFKDFLFALPVHSAYAQREGLLHLVHTDDFEAIVSREHKQLIAKRYVKCRVRWTLGTAAERSARAGWCFGAGVRTRPAG